MQFVVLTDSSVNCPVCDTSLVVVKEYDQRLAVMEHPQGNKCPFTGNHYRIDRKSGYGEAGFHDEKPAEV